MVRAAAQTRCRCVRFRSGGSPGGSASRTLGVAVAHGLSDLDPSPDDAGETVSDEIVRANVDALPFVLEPRGADLRAGSDEKLGS